MTTSGVPDSDPGAPAIDSGSWRSSLEAELARMGLRPMPAPVSRRPEDGETEYIPVVRDVVYLPEAGPAGGAPAALSADLSAGGAASAARDATTTAANRRNGSRHGRPAGRGRGPLTADSLTAEALLRTPAAVPAEGWRGTLHLLTRGVIDLGPSAAERERASLAARARTPIPGCHRLAVMSLKGGVGKTTTTAALGATFASLRGDRVVALDANPDRGTLAEKVPSQTDATVRDLLNARGSVTRYTDVRAYTSQDPSRLEVVASDTDPAVSEAFSAADYRAAVEVLERFYSLILTDCGTGLLHAAMAGVLAVADSLIVVSSANLDGARSASATLDWLDAHGYQQLVRRSVAVISAVRPGGGTVDIDLLEDHFAARCRAVVRVPFDRHLETGSQVDLAQLSGATRKAYLTLAAEVADGFPLPPGP
jgi:MinD-like ATPase involved in chromosome partitioning or flagellar assembly